MKFEFFWVVPGSEIEGVVEAREVYQKLIFSYKKAFDQVIAQCGQPDTLYLKRESDEYGSDPQVCFKLSGDSNPQIFLAAMREYHKQIRIFEKVRPL